VVVRLAAVHKTVSECQVRVIKSAYNNPINRTQTRWLWLVPRKYSQQVCAVY